MKVKEFTKSNEENAVELFYKRKTVNL